VLELLHRLFERTAFGSDEVVHRHSHIGVEDLAEVPIGGHVLDAADLDTGVSIGTMISLIPRAGAPRSTCDR
jgi:hypothetical protein